MTKLAGLSRVYIDWVAAVLSMMHSRWKSGNREVLPAEGEMGAIAETKLG